MAPKSLSTNIVYLCGEFSHVFHQVLTREFAAHRLPVTVEQFSILAVLFYQNGINQQEISSLLGRDKTTIARVISNMEKNNMITRVADGNDNRGKLIHLSRKGKAVQKKAVDLSGKLYMKAVRNIRESQLTGALRLMAMMVENIRPAEVTEKKTATSNK